ncbi:MAG: sugar phosphate isomerase/epimerase family protein [Opitutales bacterium]
MKLLVASPACCPRKTLPQALAFFQAIGFTYLEVFTDWVESRFDFSQPPSDYRSQCEAQGLRVYSMHLPRVDSVAGVDDAVRYAQAAVELGASVIIYKAHTLDTYRETLGTFLDRTQSLGLTTVITHHAGTAIEHPEHMGRCWRR